MILTSFRMLRAYFGKKGFSASQSGRSGFHSGTPHDEEDASVHGENAS
jgi:hypothetical protein